MTRWKAIQAAIALGSLLLISGGLFGCYTMLHHPGSEPVHTASDACYDCHSADPHFTSPYVYGWYSRSYGPWYDYYRYPWRHYGYDYPSYGGGYGGTTDPGTRGERGHGLGRGGRDIPVDQVAPPPGEPSSQSDQPQSESRQKPKKKEEEKKGHTGGRGGRR